MNYEKIIAEYLASTNEKVVEYVVKVLAGTERGDLRLVDVTEREACDIKAKTGVDTTGFLRYLTADCIRHITKRHGADGLSDSSMQSPEDIGRLEYVLQNYDEIRWDGKYDSQLQNADGTFSKQILYSKRINGSYYVVQTVPDTKAKRLIIKSAYKSGGKNK